MPMPLINPSAAAGALGWDRVRPALTARDKPKAVELAITEAIGIGALLRDTGYSGAQS